MTASIMICIVSMLWVATSCRAGRIAPGKYCGVAVFDQWDGCTLYSSKGVLYISEKVKKNLRQYAGKAVQINATEVYQPMNPGDGYIRKFKYLGPVPQDRVSANLKGLSLVSLVRMHEDGMPIVTITIHNNRKGYIWLCAKDLAPTLITKRNLPKPRLMGHISMLLRKRKLFKRQFSAYDYPSKAVLLSLGSSESEPRLSGQIAVAGALCTWTLDKENSLSREFMLRSGEKKEINIKLNLPDGQYDFLCGCGGNRYGGTCFISNLSAFDVKHGRTTVPAIKER